MARFDRVIPPGGSGKIALSLDSSKVHGAFTKSATVQSNDLGHASLRLTIKGVVRQYVETEPQRLFLRGYYQDQPRAGVHITSNLAGPLVINGVSAPDLEQKLTWELKTLQEGKEYQLEVVNKAGVGRYMGKLLLLTNSAKRPQVEVPIYADISGDVGYYPNSLEMGRLAAGNPGPAKHVVTLWKNRGDGFSLGKLTYDANRYEVEVAQQGTRYQVTVQPKVENFKAGEFRDTLKIETTSADLPEVMVPIHGWVQ